VAHLGIIGLRRQSDAKLGDRFYGFALLFVD
jgi:hypothetical protein